jgi:hypothetical protein
MTKNFWPTILAIEFLKQNSIIQLATNFFWGNKKIVKNYMAKI